MLIKNNEPTFWPKTHRFPNKINFKGRFLKNEIENELVSMFSGGFPLLISSGRAAINLILEARNISRPDFVTVPYYSSHCVIDAVSRIADPVLPDYHLDSAVEIIYHQWGYIAKRRNNTVLIEDAVDTLSEIGSRVLPEGGDYEIWSLPKILGTSDGAVIWTKDENDRNILVEHLNNRSNAIIQKALRGLARKNNYFYNFWNGAEASSGGNLTRSSLRQIRSALEYMPTIIADRKTKLEIVEKHIPKWAKLNKGRLPCVVPLEIHDEMILNKYNLFNLSRRFVAEDSVEQSKNTLRNITAIPIHQNVDINIIENIFEDLF